MHVTVNSFDITVFHIQGCLAVDEDTVRVNRGTGDIELALVHICNHELGAIRGRELRGGIDRGVAAIDNAVIDYHVADTVP